MCFLYTISPPEDVSGELKDLLRKILVVDPTKRITLKAIMKHKWINEGYDDDELKQYPQPEQNLSEQKQIGKSVFFFSNNVFFSTFYHLLTLYINRTYNYN